MGGRETGEIETTVDTGAAYTATESMSPMFTVHATKKLLDRVKQPVSPPVTDAAPRLGNWYATAILWKPQQIALLVNERTLLPVFMPLAPASALMRRFPDHLARILETLGVPDDVIADEVALMVKGSYAKTASRSLLGSMNDFVRLAGYYRADGRAENLLTLSSDMAQTPCGPLFETFTYPDRAVRTLLGRRETR